MIIPSRQWLHLFDFVVTAVRNDWAARWADGLPSHRLTGRRLNEDRWNKVISYNSPDRAHRTSLCQSVPLQRWNIATATHLLNRLTDRVEARLFYEGALTDHEDTFLSITKAHEKSLQKRIDLHQQLFQCAESHIILTLVSFSTYHSSSAWRFFTNYFYFYSTKYVQSYY